MTGGVGWGASSSKEQMQPQQLEQQEKQQQHSPNSMMALPGYQQPHSVQVH